MSLPGEQLNNIDNEVLIAMIEKLMKEIKLMKVENKLNERFLLKNDPELLHGITATLETAKRKPKIQFAQSVDKFQSKPGAELIAVKSEVTTEESSDFSRKTSVTTFCSYARTASVASSIGTFRSGQQAKNLSFVIKLGICIAECKLERNELNTYEQKMRRKFCELLAEIEEIKMTTQDVTHAYEAFNDYVVEKGVNPITNQVPLERFQKFIRNYIKNGTIAVEKMRLKSFTLESNYTEKKLELQQRIDMSSILRPVDFEQLKIDIKSLSSSLEEKTANMMGLKSINGNISLHLVGERRRLAAIEDELRKYREKCKTYRKETEEMCGKIVTIENETKRWSDLMEKLNQKIQSYIAPSFDNYFQLKIRLRDIEKEENSLKRKKNIALIKLKNLRPKFEIKRSVEGVKFEN